MSILDQIAYFQNRRDEVPNQELARKLAKTKNRRGLQEIADNLWNTNPNVQSNCLKVLYEIGYLAPELVADYVEDFVQLLQHKNNRIVWGSMMALSTIAGIQAGILYQHRQKLEEAMRHGSVITQDNGVRALAIVAATKDRYRRKIFPALLDHLNSCRPKDVPQLAEKILLAVDAQNKGIFLQVLEQRMPDLSSAQATRVRKVMKEAENR